MNETTDYYYVAINSADKQINGETNTPDFKNCFDVVSYGRDKRADSSSAGSGTRSSYVYVGRLELKCSKSQNKGLLKDLCDKQTPMGLITVHHTQLINGKEVKQDDFVFDTDTITSFNEGSDTVELVFQTKRLDAANQGKDLRCDANGGQAVYLHAIK